MFAPSSVLKISRTSIRPCRFASTKTQSAPGGSMMPRSDGPSNVPPATAAVEWLPLCPAPVGVLLPITTVKVSRCSSCTVFLLHDSNWTFALQNDAVHHAAFARIVIQRKMLYGAIVPDCKRANGPTQARQEAALYG